MEEMCDGLYELKKGRKESITNKFDSNYKDQKEVNLEAKQEGKRFESLGRFGSFTYTQRKTSLVPIAWSVEERCFSSVDEAMGVVLSHILKHQGEIKRRAIDEYGEYVEVLDIEEGVYVPLKMIPKRVLNQSYARVSRRLNRLIEGTKAVEEDGRKKKKSGRKNN